MHPGSRRNGELAARAQYELSDDALTFTHTEVDTRFDGQGLGSRLAKLSLDDVRRRGLKAVPICHFIAGYIRKHPEYEDLLGQPG